MQLAPSPLFCDPIFDGATDPTLIFNPIEKSWWMVYTQRRANVACRGVSWVHGTALGVASSTDGGHTWRYRGVLNMQAHQPGFNTYWAPEIMMDQGVFHMYVSFVQGVPADWSGERHILHYTSADLWNWHFESVLPLSSDYVIDACVFPLPQGGWRMWYKDEANDSHTYAADSADLYHWAVIGMQTEDCSQEGPNVFQMDHQYFMVADMWDGLAVYQSEDLTHWTRNEEKLLSEGGLREDDGNRGHHADVLTVDGRAYIFYFVHPNAKNYCYCEPHLYDSFEKRRSSIQVAALCVQNGHLTVNRDCFDFSLPMA